MLVRVLDYGGGRNDTRVSVSVYASNGLDGTTGEGPRLDGNDKWTIDSDSTAGGKATVGADCDAVPVACAGRFIDLKAYVSDGWLVANVDLPFALESNLFASPLPVTIRAGILLARIERDGSRFALRQGTLGGRVEAGAFLTSLGHVQDPFSSPGTYFCGNSGPYGQLKGLVCDSVDITTSPTATRDTACDALSIALGWEAAPAKLGHVTERPASADPCAAGWRATCP
jgi:hypothetical protein